MKSTTKKIWILSTTWLLSFYFQTQVRFLIFSFKSSQFEVHCWFAGCTGFNRCSIRFRDYTGLWSTVFTLHRIYEPTYKSPIQVLNQFLYSNIFYMYCNISTCRGISYFSTQYMWRNVKFCQIWRNFTYLHMTGVKKSKNYPVLWL